MVHLPLVLSLLAAALTAGKRVPGAFIFELDADQDASVFGRHIEIEGQIRMKLDYKLFKGISVQFNDVKQASVRAATIASLPAVRNMWPIEIHSLDDRESVFFQPIPVSVWVTRKRENGLPSKSTHVMTQVDRLHSKGITGKGIKIAVLDTGIDCM